ncbi:acyl-CoA desaturase [Rurimicrobium arvi]|uniref:Acyl-CoA desaturase n=1 Tax=Rurimicrobium arvi TaxID=2049916 RepID=A0ABP8MPJ0_9BACT
MSLPKFPKSQNSFSHELKERVHRYFEDNNIASTGNGHLYFKAIVLPLLYIFLYVHVVFFTPPTFWALAECALIGLTVAAIGFNIMHDGGHGSFSSKPWLNNIAFFSLNILGGSNFMWNMKHNVIHHAYTNIDGLDDDIDAKPFLRMATTQPKLKMHKYQHLYFWFLYSLLYLFWVFFTDFRKYFSHRVGSVPLKKMKTKDHLIFWASKIFFYGYIMVLPIIKFGLLTWLAGFLTMALTGGFVLSIVFQLAHTVQDATFPMPDETTHKMDDEWTVHQLKTTANFATNNKWICWYVGGLNFQVEHHLFPKISHIHYPAISKIVKQTCREFGISYIEYPKMVTAIASHVSYLRSVGQAH